MKVLLLAQTGAPLDVALLITAAKALLLIVVLLTAFAYATWFERRLIARIQWRLGPNRVGPMGLLQPLADGLKLLFKEQILPARARPFLFLLAPCISLVVALTVFAVIPIGVYPVNLFGYRIDPWIAEINVGLLFLLGVASLGVYGIVLAGWSSSNHYALLGAIRSSAQILSYELALGVALLSPVMLVGSLSLQEIVWAQMQQGWLVFYQPLAFLLYWISAVAEVNRAPFDLPEAEQELIAGYHVEYSGMRFALFFMAEYINMMAVSALASTMFLGGASGPLGLLAPLVGYGVGWPWLYEHPLWLVLKVAGFLFVFVWLRATFPRFRYDQLMRIGWQVLLPLGLLNLMVTSVVAALGYPLWMATLGSIGLVAGLVVLSALYRSLRPAPRPA